MPVVTSTVTQLCYADGYDVGASGQQWIEWPSSEKFSVVAPYDFKKTFVFVTARCEAPCQPNAPVFVSVADVQANKVLVYFRVDGLQGQTRIVFQLQIVQF